MGKKARLKRLKSARPGQQPSSGLSTAAAAPGFPKNNVFIITVIVVLAMGVALRLDALKSVEARSPDENIYTHQAQVITQRGMRGYEPLALEYINKESLWPFPHPLRIGYIGLLSGVMRLTGVTDVKAGSYLSSFLSVLSLALVFLIGFRYFNRWVGLYALLFMSVSPMSLAVARRTWQESTLEFVSLLLIFICCRITRDSRAPLWYLPLAILGTFCVFIKLSGIALYGLCMVWVLWAVAVRDKRYAGALVLMAIAALCMAAGVFLLVSLTGGVENIRGVIEAKRAAMFNNTYVQTYCSGPWYMFFADLWLLTPLSAVMSLAGIVYVLYFRPGRGAAPAIAVFLTAYMAALFLGKAYPLNMRYVGALYGPFYLMAGAGFWYIIRHLGRKIKRPAFNIILAFALILAVAGAALDYANFRRLIVNSGIVDLSHKLLRDVHAGTAR